MWINVEAIAGELLAAIITCILHFVIMVAALAVLSAVWKVAKWIFEKIRGFVNRENDSNK